MEDEVHEQHARNRTRIVVSVLMVLRSQRKTADEVEQTFTDAEWDVAAQEAHVSSPSEPARREIVDNLRYLEETETARFAHVDALLDRAGVRDDPFEDLT
jgi:hypothetical protein